MNYSIDIDVQLPEPHGLDMDALARAVTATLKRLDQPAGTALSLTIVDDAAIRALNSAYRAIDAPTDVLSFSALEGDGFVLPEELPRELGDIVISWESARQQADAMGHDTMAEMALLAIHGCLHLLGYDHGTAEEQVRMWDLQDDVLKTLGYTLTSYTPPEHPEEPEDA